MSKSTPDTTTIRIEIRRDEERIREKYHDCRLSDFNVWEIREAEAECRLCEGCTGLPCRKALLAGTVPFIKIEGDTVAVRRSFCKYRAAERRQIAADRRFKNARIPACYAGKTFSDYERDASNSGALAAARESLDKNTSLFIHGAPGTGKTFLAAIVAQEFMSRGRTVIFTEVPALLDTLKSTFDDSATARIDELTASLSTVDVLVLDDLGTENPTEWAVERLFLIVNARYNSQSTTLVTSNFPYSTIAERFNNPRRTGRNRDAPAGIGGSRIVSRLAQMCRAVQIKGGDRRLSHRVHQ